jgi:hypothetical protein
MVRSSDSPVGYASPVVVPQQTSIHGLDVRDLLAAVIRHHSIEKLCRAAKSVQQSAVAATKQPAR